MKQGRLLFPSSLIAVLSSAFLFFWPFARVVVHAAQQEETLVASCPKRRDPPPLWQTPAAAFVTDFCNRTQALDFFSEGYGVVDTAGCLACRRTDHLQYNTSFPSLPGSGLRIVMDDKNGSSCNRNSQMAVGHLLTKFYLPIGGRMELHARMGYGLTGPAYQSEDSFSCFGLYIHDSVSQYGYRNEISMCVSNADGKTVRLGYWVGDDGDKVCAVFSYV